MHGVEPPVIGPALHAAGRGDVLAPTVRRCHGRRGVGGADPGARHVDVPGARPIRFHRAPPPHAVVAASRAPAAAAPTATRKPPTAPGPLPGTAPGLISRASQGPGPVPRQERCAAGGRRDPCRSTEIRPRETCRRAQRFTRREGVGAARTAPPRASKAGARRPAGSGRIRAAVDRRGTHRACVAGVRGAAESIRSMTDRGRFAGDHTSRIERLRDAEPIKSQ